MIELPLAEIYETLTEASIFYHKNLPKKVRDYLNKRKISDEVISQFKLGFSDGNLLAKSKISKEKLLSASLLWENSNQEYFKNFITFPNFLDGKCVYISSRNFGE